MATGLALPPLLYTQIENHTNAGISKVFTPIVGNGEKNLILQTPQFLNIKTFFLITKFDRFKFSIFHCSLRERDLIRNQIASKQVGKLRRGKILSLRYKCEAWLPSLSG